MSGEYVEHAPGGKYIRLQDQRYNLQIDLEKTNGFKSLPERPIPLRCGVVQKTAILNTMSEKRKQEHINLRLRMLEEELENGSLSPWKHQEELLKLLITTNAS